MATVEALYTEFKEAVRQPNYFNGRLLTATDLREEQNAARTRDARLGRAVGAGVVEGLRVRRAGTGGVIVEKGLAINGLGQTVELGVLVSFDLGRTERVSKSHSSFRNCTSRDEPEEVAEGAYILVAAPATEYEGQVEVQGVLGGGSCCGKGRATSEARACGHRWELEGVSFQLVPLPDDAVDSAAEDDRLGNLLAAWCLGDDEPADQFHDGLARVSGIERRHVPLALIYWQDGVLLVDNWAAKRPCAPPAPAGSFGRAIGEGVRARGVARFLCFQDSIEALARRTGTAAAATLKGHYRFLPPAGLVPLGSTEVIQELEKKYITSEAGGFQGTTFFEGLNTTMRSQATAEEMRLALESSWRADATDLELDPALDVYLVTPAATDGAIDLAAAMQAVLRASLDEFRDEFMAAVDGATSADALAAIALLDRLEDGADLSPSELQQLNLLFTKVLGTEALAAVRESLVEQLKEELQGRSPARMWALFIRRTRNLFHHAGGRAANRTESETESDDGAFIMAEMHISSIMLNSYFAPGG